MQLKIGELAKRSGLTVRTLHHYDAIGLLSPSGRSEGGYRLYSYDDVARLQQIQAIKQLGFSLADVGGMLSGNKLAVADLLRQQRALLDRQIEHAKRLRDGLSVLEHQLEQGLEPSLAEWLSALELMALHSKYFSTEEVQAMRVRKRDVEELSEAAWRQFHGEVAQLLAAGVSPADERAQTLARIWIKRSHQLSGGDVSIMARLGRMHESEPGLRARSGATMEILDYLKRACLIDDTRVFEKYLSASELTALREAMLRHFGQWPLLVLRVRAQLKRDARPESPALQALAREWHELFLATYGNGDPSTAAKMAGILQQESEWSASKGVDEALLRAIFQAKDKLSLHTPNLSPQGEAK